MSDKSRFYHDIGFPEESIYIDPLTRPYEIDYSDTKEYVEPIMPEMTLCQAASYASRAVQLINKGKSLAVAQNKFHNRDEQEDPISIGISQMNSIERFLYDAIEQGNSLPPFNHDQSGDDDLQSSKMPVVGTASYKALYSKYTEALRMMYKREDITAENTAWWRNKYRTLIPACNAYAKIISARNANQKGVVKMTAYEFEEFRTVKAEISALGRIMEREGRLIRERMAACESYKLALVQRRDVLRQALKD
uniref:Uncharacterized protein n=1 Tax=Spongospora subterranea TaxID=70186 RepID=A0A0H5RA24_9EUKA|eukprot:CRZ10527.1 hypothetical protein [Spongospora subterranea]